MNERILVLVLFWVSGAAGLVYEVVWMRQLALTFGVTVFAASSVLAAYMAGLALGSLLVGRRIDRSRNALRVYALLEVGIGLSALAVPFALEASRQLYLIAGELLEERFLAFNFVRALLAFLVLLVPTTLMGGTVPAIGRYLLEGREQVGWNVALLYGLNTFGAVVGCLAAGFLLIPHLGLAASTRIAVGTNLLIGFALLLSRAGQPAASRPQRQAAGGPAPSRSPRPVVLLAGSVFALSGFAALAYEVLWTRVLIVYVHNTSYAFTVMLAVFLAGLAIGDALLIRLYDRIRRPLLSLGTIQVLVGLSIVAAAAAYVPLEKLSVDLLGGRSPATWGGTIALMAVRAALVMLPFTVLLGTIFPLVARIACRGADRPGESLGLVYAANTGGAILGALATPFLLIPSFGVRGSILLLAGLNVLLGLLCWLADLQSLRARVAALVVAAGCALAAPAAIPTTIFYDALEGGFGKLVYYHEGITDTTGVWELPGGGRIVTYGDMRGTAGTMTNDLNRAQAHLAHLLHPRPTRSLQIGFGVGNTLAGAALHPEVEQLDCVELSPHVRQTAGFFWTNDDVLSNPKVHLIIDDGRNYLLRTEERYDVITLEPPDIFTADVVNLYTREFYELAARALTDDGLIVQWIPTGEMGEDEARMLVRSVQDVFAEVSLWNNGASALPGAARAPQGPLLVVGSQRPLRIDLRALERRMRVPSLRADLDAIGIRTRAALLARFIAAGEGVTEWTEGVPAVTDDLTRVDSSSARSVSSGFGMGIFRRPPAEGVQRLLAVGRLYQRLRQPIAPILLGSGDRAGEIAAIERQRRRYDRALDGWAARALAQLER